MFSRIDRSENKNFVSFEWLSKTLYNRSIMKLFNSSRTKQITLEEYIKITNSFALEKNSSGYEFYYITESFCIIVKYKCVMTNFGMDFEDRFDHFVVAFRDGKTEYDAINKKISQYQNAIEKNPANKKIQNDYKKYKKIIEKIPKYSPYEKAKSGDCFENSLVNIDYVSFSKNAEKCVVLDVETNGLSKKNDDLLSISIYDPYKKVCYNRFLPLDLQPSVATTYINGIKDDDLKGKLHINQEEANKILDYFNLKNKAILVYGPDDFDVGFLQNYFLRNGITGFENLNVVNIKRYVPSGAFAFAGSASKDNLCRLFGIVGVENIHSGINDCLLEWKLFEKFIEFKPIRIGDTYYKYNKNYIVPISVLIQNPMIYRYSEISKKYLLGEKQRIFHYEVSERALRKIRKFDTNISGISLENIIYFELGAKKQDNHLFLLRNKMQLERIAKIETNLNVIDVREGEDGLLEAVNEKDIEQVKEVNNVALILKKELKSTFEFIKYNIFRNEDILSQELVFSEDRKILALCDLSSKSAVMEIKTVSPSESNIGYLSSEITDQLYYQANQRDTYYLHIFIGGNSSIEEAFHTDFCDISIYKIEISEYSKEEYEKKLSKLTWDEEKFLVFIKNNPECRYKDLEQAFPYYSKRMIESRVKSLENKKHIIRVGNTRNYHWELCKLE